jgi:hypothetical protein
MQYLARLYLYAPSRLYDAELFFWRYVSSVILFICLDPESENMKLWKNVMS